MTNDLQTRIREHLTARFGDVSRFERLPSTQEGKDFYDVARVTVGGRRMIAKWSFDRPDDRAHLRKEFDASGFLVAHGIPTAAPIAFDESLPLFMMEELTGRACAPEDLRPEIAFAAGALLRDFHALPAVDTPVTVERWAGESLPEELAIRMEKWDREGPAVFPGEWDELRRTFDRVLTQIPVQRGRSVVRRDIHEENCSCSTAAVWLPSTTRTSPSLPGRTMCGRFRSRSSRPKRPGAPSARHTARTPTMPRQRPRRL